MSAVEVLDWPLEDLAHAVASGHTDRATLAQAVTTRAHTWATATGLNLQQLGFALTTIPRIWGDPHGPLAGIPLAIKDLHPIANTDCTHGSRQLTHHADTSDPVVAAFLAAGCTITGTSATSELGLSCYTEPRGLPAVTNPWLPGRTVGGSSGGAAALVARGIIPIAHGTDGGGSIRVPAAACGIVGYKPAHNATGAELRAHGLIGRTVNDIQFMSSHLTLPGAAAPTTVRQPTGRIGILTTPLHAYGVTLDPLIHGALHIAAARLRAAGWDVVPVAAPYPVETIELLRTVMSYRCRTFGGERYGKLANYFGALGRSISAEQYADAVARIEALPEEVFELWGTQARVDAVLCPTISAPPPPIGHFAQMPPAEDFDAQTRWTPWATLWNFTGWAGISVPVAATRTDGPYRGWPVSVHLGAVGSTNPTTLFTLARCVEVARG